MKTFITIIIIAFALSFSVPAYAYSYNTVNIRTYNVPKITYKPLFDTNRIVLNWFK